jgi:hypothetical protein
MKKSINIVAISLAVCTCILVQAQTTKPTQKKPQTSKSSKKTLNTQNHKKTSIMKEPSQAEKDSLQIQDMDRYNKDTYKTGSTNTFYFDSPADSVTKPKQGK